jgi:hypothetical protein
MITLMFSQSGMTKISKGEIFKSEELRASIKFGINNLILYSLNAEKKSSDKEEEKSSLKEK